MVIRQHKIHGYLCNSGIGFSKLEVFGVDDNNTVGICNYGAGKGQR